MESKPDASSPLILFHTHISLEKLTGFYTLLSCPLFSGQGLWRGARMFQVK
jgi:hypothetical protein